MDIARGKARMALMLGFVLAIPVAVASAGQFDGLIRTVSEIFALEALCPALKVNQPALSESATLNKLGSRTLQYVMAEGRRLTPETMKDFADMPQSKICNYARETYGGYTAPYLIDR